MRDRVAAARAPSRCATGAEHQKLAVGIGPPSTLRWRRPPAEGRSGRSNRAAADDPAGFAASGPGVRCCLHRAACQTTAGRSTSSPAAGRKSAVARAANAVVPAAVAADRADRAAVRKRSAVRTSELDGPSPSGLRSRSGSWPSCDPRSSAADSGLAGSEAVEVRGPSTCYAPIAGCSAEQRAVAPGLGSARAWRRSSGRLRRRR